MNAAVITISDSSARGARSDISGPQVCALLSKKGFSIVQTLVIPDEQIEIEAALRRLANEAQLVVTTGGTGIATRDVTPEATRAVCERTIDGISERMRLEGAKYTPFAALSRAVCGTSGNCVILNLPGSPAAAIQSLQAVIEILPHALQLLAGKTSHPPESPKKT